MINKIIKFKNIQKTKILNGLFKSKNFYGEFLTKTKKKNFYYIYGYRYNFSIIKKGIYHKPIRPTANCNNN